MYKQGILSFTLFFYNVYNGQSGDAALRQHHDHGVPDGVHVLPDPLRRRDRPGAEGLHDPPPPGGVLHRPAGAPLQPQDDVPVGGERLPPRVRRLLHHPLRQRRHRPRPRPRGGRHRVAAVRRFSDRPLHPRHLGQLRARVGVQPEARAARADVDEGPRHRHLRLHLRLVRHPLCVRQRHVRPRLVRLRRLARVHEPRRRLAALLARRLPHADRVLRRRDRGEDLPAHVHARALRSRAADRVPRRPRCQARVEGRARRRQERRQGGALRGQGGVGGAAAQHPRVRGRRRAAAQRADGEARHGGRPGRQKGDGRGGAPRAGLPDAPLHPRVRQQSGARGAVPRALQRAGDPPAWRT